MENHTEEAKMRELCKKIDDCFKIDMLKDKDMLDFQFAESVRKVCSKCKEFEGGTTTRPLLQSHKS